MPRPAEAAQPPQAAATKAASDLIVFPVDNIQWAGTAASKSKPGEFLTTFRVHGGPFQKFGVVCYPEALQKAGFDIGGAGAGWGLNLEGQGWSAHALPGENTNAYGNPSPKKVLYFSKAEF